MDQTTVYIAPVDIVGTIILPSEISTVTIGTTTVIVEADPDVVIIESFVPATPSIIVAPDQTSVTIGGDDPIAVTIVNPEIRIIDSGIPGPEGPAGSSGASEADEVSFDNAVYSTVQAALDGLLYVAPRIDSFTNSVGTVELGSSVSNVNLAWSFNKGMTSASINNTPIDPAAHSAVETGPFISNAAWTLRATDGQNTATASTSLSFLLKRYWGVSASESLDNAGVLALSGEFATDYQKSVTFDASGGRYIYYAFPASFGTPTHVTVGGLTFSDFTVSTLDFTNASGHAETYNVIRVNNMQTGAAIVVNWS